MENINIRRIGLMMRKNILEIHKSSYLVLLFIICHQLYIVFTNKNNGDNNGLFYSGPFILFIIYLSEGFILSCKSKPNRIQLLQTPSSAGEKTIALFALFSMIILLLLTMIVIFRNPEFRQIPMSEFIRIIEFGIHLLWFSTVYALFRLNYSKSYTYSSISGAFSLLLLFIFISLYERFEHSLHMGHPLFQLPDILANNFHVSRLMIEIVTIFGFWHIIYRRLATSQIN